MIISTFLILSHRNKGYVILMSMGLRVKIANLWPLISWKQQLFQKAFLNKNCSKWKSEHHAAFILSLNGPLKVLIVRTLKPTCTDKSRTVKNIIFFTKTAKLFFWFPTKETDLSTGAQEGAKVLKFSETINILLLNI